MPLLPAVLLFAALFAPSPVIVRGDLEQVLEGMRASQTKDLESWAEYRFRRTVIRERRSSSGEVKERERWDFQVVPEEGGFDELLLLVDGEEPSEREIRHHRKKARFEKHYRQVRTDTVEEKDENSFPFHRLLYMPAYRYLGIVDRDGVSCHKLQFDPAPASEGGDIADRFSSAMGGTLWVTVDGYHLYKASAKTERSLSLGLGLAKIESVEVEFTGTEVEPDTWLPSRIQVISKGRILASPFSKRNTYLYSDFRRPAGP